MIQVEVICSFIKVFAKRGVGGTEQQVRVISRGLLSGPCPSLNLVKGTSSPTLKRLLSLSRG